MIKITLRDGRGEVVANGVTIYSVCAIDVHADTDGVPTVTLTVIDPDIEIEADDTARLWKQIDEAPKRQ